MAADGIGGIGQGAQGPAEVPADLQMLDIISNPQMEDTTKLGQLQNLFANLSDSEKTSLYDSLKNQNSSDPFVQQLRTQLGSTSTVDQVLKLLNPDHAQADNSIADVARPVLFKDGGMKSEVNLQGQLREAQIRQALPEKPPFELNPQYQKLPDSVKLHIQNAISSGKLDEAAKDKLIEMVTRLGFDKLSPSTQHEFINLQGKHPQLTDNLIKLSHSIGFHSLGTDGQSELLKLLETNAKDPAKINNLTEVANAKGIGDLTPANRKLVYDSLNGPHADDIAKNFKQMAFMYKGPLKMDPATQKEVLNRMIDYTNKGDATKVQDLIDMTTVGKFSVMDAYDQKLVLKILEDSKGMSKSLNLMFLSSGFEQMTGVQRSTVLNLIADMKGDSRKITSITDTITTPGFSEVSNKVKQAIVDRLQKDPMDTHVIQKYLSQPWFLAADENRQIELLKK